MQNFPKVYHLKVVFEENFLRLTVTVHFQENEYFENVNFLSFFQSMSYKNLVVTKQIYFTPTS